MKDPKEGVLADTLQFHSGATEVTAEVALDVWVQSCPLLLKQKRARRHKTHLINYFVLSYSDTMNTMNDLRFVCVERVGDSGRNRLFQEATMLSIKMILSHIKQYDTLFRIRRCH